MKTRKDEYTRMVQKASPNSRLVKNCRWAFVVGGSICVVGEILYEFYVNMNFINSDARLMASITVIVYGVLAAMVYGIILHFIMPYVG